MPAILVLLDNYNGFREKTDDCYEADMIKLDTMAWHMEFFLLLRQITWVAMDCLTDWQTVFQQHWHW